MILFVEQPNLELKRGISVTADTKLTYKTDKVQQSIEDLVLKTHIKEEGSNGYNSYESESDIKIQLQPGNILLFDEGRGYYMPTYPVTTIDDAISDISSLEDFAELEFDEEGNEVNDDSKGNETEGPQTD